MKLRSDKQKSHNDCCKITDERYCIMCIWRKRKNKWAKGLDKIELLKHLQ